MSGESISAIAYEMLKNTNVFSKGVSDIQYSTSQQDIINFWDLVDLNARAVNHRYRGKSAQNLQFAYDAIAKAMASYISGYAAPFAYKQRSKKKFAEWLDRIQAEYEVPAPYTPAELNTPTRDEDTGIALLKMLHSRRGITYTDIENKLDIQERAIQKDMIKLSPSLYKGPSTAKEPYVPFRLGGQPLHAEITALPADKDDPLSEKRFFSKNTVHPIVLQENTMQLASLLTSLYHQYEDYEDSIASLIAIDIWSQMTDYAKNKIIDYFAYNDECFMDFINILQDECPDDHACTYRTERSLLYDLDMSIDQAVSFLMKAPGRTGTITLTDGQKIIVQQFLAHRNDDRTTIYTVATADGTVITFKHDSIEYIKID